MKPTPFPHDRSSAFFDKDENFSQRFIESIDLWATALLNDDGIFSPLGEKFDSTSSTIISKQSGIFAGKNIIDRVCNHWAPSLKFEWNYSDGQRISLGEILVKISGDKGQLLKMERPILNILGRLSGIATTAANWCNESKISIASTRKTTWGLLDKWAVHMGGALTHRLDRNDALMLKENDLAAQYPKLNPQDRIKSALMHLNIENIGAFAIIEVRNKDEALIAAETWESTDNGKSLTIMLDNIPVIECNNIIKLIRNLNFKSKIYFEASGGITLDNLKNWDNSLVDVISTSSIHRGTKPLDLSLLFEEA